MPKRAYGILFLLGLLVALGGASLQTNPGYMDAFYYFYGGKQIAGGHGWEEIFLWNYLSDPGGLPNPAFTYWMPLTAMAAALGIWLFSGFLLSFEAAQLVFVLMAACIPPLTAGLAFSITGEKRAGWLSGVLAAFTGFYTSFLTTTDSFTPVMLLGVVFFLAYLRLERGRSLVFGLLAGLMHLSRADGLLWLGVAGLGRLFDLAEQEGEFSIKRLARKFVSWEYIIQALIVVAGYLLVMAPWFWRNLQVFGGLFPPGGSRAVWVLDYNELYAYPAAKLTMRRWMEAGIWPLMVDRGEALWVNLQTTFASMGVFLPGALAVLGFWRNRKMNVVRIGLVGWGVLFLAMSLVFPFSGVRGSYYHSGAAFVPLILSMVPDGIDALTKASLRRFKKWEDRKIRPFYTGVVVVFVVIFSLVTYFSAVVGTDGEPGFEWNQVEERYTQVEAALAGLGASPQDIVLTTNPPGYAVVADRPAVAMPDGGPETLQAVAEDFGVRWVLVEPNHPEGLDVLYEEPQDVGSLVYEQTAGEVHIFSLKLED